MKKFLAVLLAVVMVTTVAGCAEKPTDTVTIYTVSFDSMGGTMVDSQVIEEGKSVTKPEAPKKEGFTFVEWQLDGAAYDFSTVITKDLVLTAYYTMNESTEIVLVLLDYQNGQQRGIVEIIKGGKMTEPPAPLKEGYKFIGWYVDGEKYNFSTVLNENITLTAKWEIDKQATTKNKGTTTTNSTGTNSTTSNNASTGDDDTIPDEDFETEEEINARYDVITEKYAGRWYLNGYADVCIDVSKHPYYGAFVIQSQNFSFPAEGADVKGYAVYPDKSIDPIIGGGYVSGAEIIYRDWDNSLIENNVILGNDCIYISNYKFVREKGTKDRYYDTCYKEALGTWYLYNSPESSIEIFTYSNDYLTEFHAVSFGITTKHFDIENFATNVGGDAGGGRADIKADWDKFGISVSDGVLTITNENGTRTFYKTKTYIQVTGLSLDKTNIKMAPYESQTLNVTISPSNAYYKTVTWTSSNSSVVTVSTGSGKATVTAQGEGSATITVKTTDGNYIATCNVTVSVPRATGVSLNKNSVELYRGETETLTATVSPTNASNKDITWTSSNTNVVTVSSSGKITAKGAGTAIITVKTVDGGYTASCQVTVKNPKLTVTASTGIEYRVSNTGTAMGVFCEAKPSGGSGDYVAYSIKLYYNGTLIAESSQREVFVTPVKYGTYTAEVYVKDSDGNEATSTTVHTIS